MAFLPVTKEEMLQRGWETPDFVYVCGDAYVDHPSFGHAIISRTLEAHGYKVCMLPQPDWKKKDEFMRFGKPRLGFLVSAGNIDSMVNHYSVNKRRRDKDNYTDNGEMGKRPDRATIVYSQKIRECYKDVPIIIGGVEASLRRLAHYDYWDDKVRQSILVDSGADLISYGMGENSIVEIADALDSGMDVSDIVWIKGTVYKSKRIDHLDEYDLLPSYTEICESKDKYCDSFKAQFENTDAITGHVLVEPYKGLYVIQNPPALPLTRQQMDDTYSLPYERTFHPMYKYIPAIEEVQFSIISNRGCFGACSFCALTFHQGRTIQSRSKESIVEEAKQITQHPQFKGYIHDVGGPTAQFYHPSCHKQTEHGVCKNRQCLDPKPCRNLNVTHKDYLDILKELRTLPKVKKVFVRSGVRYDYLMHDKDDTFFRELVQHHISGQLKVAPEHVSNKVLRIMGKCNHELYETFREKYIQLNEEYGKKQYLVPYLMSSHPGSDLDAAIELACYLKKIGHTPQQVQDFYPTPATLSTTIYYTGMHPITREKIYVAKSFEEKLAQRALMQYNYPKNYDIVYRALVKAGREDLIGYKQTCLIPPHKNPPKRNEWTKNKPVSKTGVQRKTSSEAKKTETPRKPDRSALQKRRGR
ncbi:MAG: YgiQ family radical SAM protein [Erysipelotrichaceae bacterium]|nr:YgiQ family radical SAM protein [Erysipelotrichaceae bacterium]